MGDANRFVRLDWAKKIGADSVDGTGYFLSEGQKKTFKEWFDGREQIQWVI